MSAAAFQAQLRAEIEAPQPMMATMIGAAQHVTRYGAPRLGR